jgi:membrane protein DedA with SNARE-associated domain
MKLRPLIWAGLLVAMAFSLARALVTHDGVGPLEYIVGIAVVVVLAAAALRAGRRAVRPG